VTAISPLYSNHIKLRAQADYYDLEILSTALFSSFPLHSLNSTPQNYNIPTTTSQVLQTMTASTPSKLFQPIAIGSKTLQHRVVLSPLTRFRATKKSHVPINPLVKTYYSQRSSTPGTLLITEATFIAPQAGGYDNVPGIWSEKQVEAWKEVGLFFVTFCEDRLLMETLQRGLDNNRRTRQQFLYLYPTLGSWARR